MSNSRARSIAIVVVNWNRWQLSLDCLASLRTSVGATWHLFIVDNASTDDSRNHLRDLGDDVTVILSSTNRGWTGGNNLGITAALRAGYNHIFILNNDTSVNSCTLAILLDAFETDPSCPILGPIELNIKGEPDFVGATLDPRIGIPVEIKAHEINLGDQNRVYPTRYIRGAGIFAHRRHFDEVGLFDDTFFLYYDDTDWCFRAAAKGLKIAMVRNATITHIGSASTGQASPLLIYFMVRNGLLFVERHARLSQRVRFSIWLLRWLGTLWGRGARAPRLAAIILGDSALAVAARQGVRDYFARRFGDCPPAIRCLNKIT